MPKPDDTNTIPEQLTAPWLKRFFKRKFGIPVRIHGASSSGWVQIWIESDRTLDHRVDLCYNYHFPSELGKRCMRIVYSDSEKLREQTWGGNITAHSISLHGSELRELLHGIIDRPIEPSPA